jgi:UDP-N-acetylmuramate--alanine ligase
VVLHYFEDSIDLIPKIFSSKILVIITPAVSKHSEWNYFIEREYNIKKELRSRDNNNKDTFVLLLRERTEKTTSSILGHILYESGADVTAL